MYICTLAPPHMYTYMSSMLSRWMLMHSYCVRSKEHCPSLIANTIVLIPLDTEAMKDLSYDSEIFPLVCPGQGIGTCLVKGLKETWIKSLELGLFPPQAWTLFCSFWDPNSDCVIAMGFWTLSNWLKVHTGESLHSSFLWVLDPKKFTDFHLH